jgi:hypothetical protein
MRHLRPFRALAALALIAAAAPAMAFNCYLVLDRSDNLIYQDVVSPVDLSDRGAAQREQMRARGEHLISLDSERCPQVVFFTGTAGTKNLAVDQVVAGLPTRDLGARYGMRAGDAAAVASIGAGGKVVVPAARPATSSRSAVSGKKY